MVNSVWKRAIFKNEKTRPTSAKDISITNQDKRTWFVSSWSLSFALQECSCHFWGEMARSCLFLSLKRVNFALSRFFTFRWSRPPQPVANIAARYQCVIAHPLITLRWCSAIGHWYLLITNQIWTNAFPVVLFDDNAIEGRCYVRALSCASLNESAV